MVLSSFVPEMDIYVPFCGGPNRQSGRFAEHVMLPRESCLCFWGFFFVVVVFNGSLL